MTARHITYVPLDAVKPHPRNPKTHDEDAIIESIGRHGFTSPLIVCERTALLAAGHGRYLALVVMYAAGAPVPSGIEVDDDGQWLVPLIRGWSSKNDVELLAYIVKDNQLGALGAWDDRLLSSIVEEINADDGDLFDSLRLGADEVERLLKYSTDASDVGGPALMYEKDEPLTSAEKDADDGELPDDMGMTDVPDGPEHERVRCPECGTHFRPGDRF